MNRTKYTKIKADITRTVANLLRVVRMQLCSETREQQIRTMAYDCSYIGAAATY
jgi:hypothetical protein